jgi:hypothetical protein
LMMRTPALCFMAIFQRITLGKSRAGIGVCTKR